jgi:DNA end-binding protein Ku
MLVGEFDPTEYRDEYRHKVEALIEAKSHGKLYRFEHPKRKARPASLEQALAASLTRAAKERRSA